MVKYILELNADADEAREMLLDNGVPAEEINTQEIERTINNLNDMIEEDYMYNFPILLELEGYDVKCIGWGRWKVYVGGYDSLVAVVEVDYTHDNNLEIMVNVMDGASNLAGELHRVLLETTFKREDL